MSVSVTRAIDVDVDVWSDTNLRDPFPLYAELRALAPVVRLVPHDAYAVTRYAEIRDVLQEWESFTSAKGVGMSPLINARGGRGVIASDPPVHTARRRVLNTQLLPAALKPHEEFIESRRDRVRHPGSRSPRRGGGRRAGSAIQCVGRV